MKILNSLEQSLIKPHKNCRICKSKDLVPYFDFGQMPLANRNITFSELNEKELAFPLKLLFCKVCGLSQLSVVVSPQLLYQDYLYHSSVSSTFQIHCKNLVKTLKDKLNLKSKDLVVEIASNDGCLLLEFVHAGFQAVGVEPARNLASLTDAKGIPTYCQFWGESVAREVQSKFGKPVLIIGTNIIAHIDSLNNFLSTINSVLASEGYFVFEVPYMANYIEQLEFDTTYHEHLSYFLLSPLKRILEAKGFRIIDVEKLVIHGGSIRVICCKMSAVHAVSEKVNEFLTLEKDMGLLDEEVYFKFATRIENIKNELKSLLTALKQDAKHIAAYGASAKGNILLNYCEIGKDIIDYIVDDTPAKQGKFQSGTQIPIVEKIHMLKKRPDYLLILAWNFTEELMNKTTEYYQSGGNYIIPLPKVKIVSSPHLGLREASSSLS